MNYKKVQGRAVQGGDANGRVTEADHQENPSLLEQCHRPSDQGENHSCNLNILFLMIDWALRLYVCPYVPHNFLIHQTLFWLKAPTNCGPDKI